MNQTFIMLNIQVYLAYYIQFSILNGC